LSDWNTTSFHCSSVNGHRTVLNFCIEADLSVPLFRHSSNLDDPSVLAHRVEIDIFPIDVPDNGATAVGHILQMVSKQRPIRPSSNDLRMKAAAKSMFGRAGPRTPPGRTNTFSRRFLKNVPISDTTELLLLYSLDSNTFFPPLPVPL
jgi:hypothetical protein